MTKTTRDKLIDAMIDALQRKGLHGVGLNELLAAADAPKGSLYHHFPNGKTELAVAAIERVGQRAEQAFAALFERQSDPLDALTIWLQSALGQLQESAFERGCPLATVALESGPQDHEIRAALANAFAAIRQALQQQLQRHGYPQPEGLAALFVALYEGGLLQARVAGSSEPLKQAVATLLHLTRQHRMEPT
ncbi:TetR/AcrR family transcriptional regulator [Pseudomonas chengduensis]|jgi:TetR/AcrR family transcriptional regulator, lmrAB and yxaGH operons repressor|uniref:Transcriptional regulator, TetR family n=2 Tax=Pseudomonadaceae TaxID=135621 RepID=A0A1H2MFD5_9PSED|nr:MULTISPECIES: TetR/AcrR family transcriptional regulator [Pseudomonas]KQO43283.1 TetR family transcriptional regulator [Pseudomonas sp. Leaf83]MBP3063967.1 TetR family transcriptional regulator [Pseudomonas chengduensis]MDH0960189.1 TetR/AcrR family transcriptional regulator [Pseudomonas chengduensis]MDH1537744.1 TetR/AcrR family transcriptional regulator [Pseudomonas chengduensis]MDH1621512.1 TetR/AcrR family transcriptional regulator [Pseudomonas chengduensis]